MNPDRRPEHDALLCERCGYDLRGSRDDSSCPECGRPIAESLPGRRRGSAWQRSPSPRAVLETGAAFLRTPRRASREIEIEPARSRALLATNVLAGAAVFQIGVVIARIMMLGQGGIALGDLWFGVSFLVAALAMTQIERIGIEAFGRRRRWRITRQVSLAVCAHASVGWVVAGALVAGAMLLLAALPHDLRFLPSGGLLRGTRLAGLHVMPVLLGLSGFAGMLVFETLVYFGVRECRFANHAGVRESLEDSANREQPAT